MEAKLCFARFPDTRASIEMPGKFLSKMVWDTERTGNSSTRPIVAEWTTAAERSGRESEMVDAHPRRGQWLNGSGRRR
jgi:hypothetical protein